MLRDALSELSNAGHVEVVKKASVIAWRNFNRWWSDLIRATASCPTHWTWLASKKLAIKSIVSYVRTTLLDIKLRVDLRYRLTGKNPLQQIEFA